MAETIGHRQKWLLLSALGAALGIFMLDETVVGVALPSIQSDLSLSVTHGHWVVNIYLLVLACVAAAGGRLCDIFGYKRLFITGVSLFGLASIACGLAPDLMVLLLARAAQGFGAAIIFPATMAMITIIFSEEERGRALGVFGAIGTSFLALGPFVGGAITELASWRWIFWINPPLVIAAVLTVQRLWHDPPRESVQEKFDWTGMANLATGLSLTVYAIMEGPDWGWAHPLIWICLVCGLALIANFVRIELKVRAPLIHISLFANPAFLTCNLMIFTGQFTKIAVLVIAAIYLQRDLGLGPLAAGIAILAGAAPSPLSSVWGGRAVDRQGARKPALQGMFVTFLIFLGMAVAVSWQSYWWLLVAVAAWGLSNSFVFVPALHHSTSCVPEDKRGQVGGIMLTSQLLGGTIGMAICGTLVAATGEFQLPFLVTACLSLAVFGLVWWSIREA